MPLAFGSAGASPSQQVRFRRLPFAAIARYGFAVVRKHPKPAILRHQSLWPRALHNPIRVIRVIRG